MLTKHGVVPAPTKFCVMNRIFFYSVEGCTCTRQIDRTNLWLEDTELRGFASTWSTNLSMTVQSHGRKSIGVKLVLNLDIT